MHECAHFAHPHTVHRELEHDVSGPREMRKAMEREGIKKTKE